MKVVFRTVGLIILGLILFFIPTSLPEATPPPTTDGCTSLGNPAAAYCQTVMGYDYQVVTAADGAQNGLCSMPDGDTCDQWDFYAGKCGQAYSWCEQAGYRLETRSDGKDPYSFEYSTCVDKEGRAVGSTAILSGLTALESPKKVDMAALGFKDEPEAPREDHGVPPASFDWRNYLGQNWVTPVKDQLTCGSCWAFSAVGVAEASHNIIASNSNLDLDLSEQYLVSTCYTGGDCGGGLEYNALAYIKTDGVTDEACYPYLSANSLCSARCADWGMRLKFVPNNHTDLSYTGTDMKNYLSSYGPITIALGYGGDFGGYFDGSNIYRCTNDTGSGGDDGANHAVVAVGYNDAGGYWIAKNSWGSTWNESGYFRIGYNECNVETSGIAWVETSLPTLNKVFLPLLMKPAGTTPPDPILNGDFEAGQVSWTEFSTHGWDLIINSGFPGTVTPHGGSWAVWLGGDDDDTSYISQTVMIPAGRSQLHFWYWIASEDVCGYDYFKVYADATLIGTWDLCDATSTAGWTQVSIDLSSFAGSSKSIKFEVMTDFVLNSNVFLDDVSFEVFAVTSQPILSSEQVSGAAMARE